MKDKIRENGIDYILAGDYYIPDIQLPEEPRPIGRFGLLHRDFLEECHPIRFQRIVLSGNLKTYLADVNEQAQERLDRIIWQMAETEGVTEDLKAHAQMEWVGRMNSIRSRAEEIVLRELIFV